MENFDELLIENKSIVISDIMNYRTSTYIYKNETKKYIDKLLKIITRSNLLYKVFPVLYSKIESKLYTMNMTKVSLM